MYLRLSAWKNLKTDAKLGFQDIFSCLKCIAENTCKSSFLFALFLIYEICWIRNQVAAVVAGRATNFASFFPDIPVASCHLSPLLSHPFLLRTNTCPFPIVLSWPFISLSNQFLYLATHFHDVATFTTLLLANYIPFFTQPPIPTYFYPPDSLLSKPSIIQLITTHLRVSID